MQNVFSRVALSALVLSLAACGDSSSSSPGLINQGKDPTKVTDSTVKPLPAKTADREQWFEDTTVSLRGSMRVPSASDLFGFSELQAQQLVFDPGATLHCSVEDDPAFQSAVMQLGGVQWGYSVSVLEDQSQPRIMSGFYLAYPTAGATNDFGAEAPVEIAEADIVGLSDQAALYYTPGHGLMLVDLTSGKPTLSCAAQLPGEVKKFYLYKEHLIALVESWPVAGEHHAYLFHMKVDGTALSFVESVDLGDVTILDSRRFNGDLVVYGGFSLADKSNTGSTGTGSGGNANIGGGAAFSPVAPSYYQPALHRSLQVFHIGDKLEPSMHDTLLDTHKSNEQLYAQFDTTTKVGAQVDRQESFGQMLSASDHYFVVTQDVTKTFFDGMQTQTYQVCTASHTVDRTYRNCQTQYETRPNPDYTPPDTQGGDRTCNGQTLRDCLHEVAKVSNPTIEVPVSIKCEDVKYQDWICDTYETKQYEFPTFHSEDETKLFIYAYTGTGFVRLADQASTLDPNLQGTAADTTLTSVNTGSATHELLLKGRVQTLQFQNGYLYAIADQQLLTFAVNGSSLIQTSSVTGTSNTLQTSLFTDDKLYLSDYSWISNQDMSTLRVFDLSNPAFPKQASMDRNLPGGHDVILPVREGIFTIGQVNGFENMNRSFLKLGLFSDPFTDEKSYAILGTDLSYPTTTAGREKSYYFDSAQERLFLPYSGADLNDAQHSHARVDVSTVMNDMIVPTGGFDLPETPERVRGIPGTSDAVLTFAPDSIELLAQDKTTWKASDVFAYFRPVALYRLDDTDLYAELLRLGNQCKLHITPKDQINERNDAQMSPAFDCFGYGGGVTAYGHNLLFTQTQGVSFDDDGKVTPLTVAQVTDIYLAIQKRMTCVLDPTKTSNEAIDYTKTPDLSKAKCYTPEELQAAQNAFQQQSQPTTGG